MLQTGIVFWMSFNCYDIQAQKGLPGNLVKIRTDQYGFVVGSNQKDSLYFVTVTSASVPKEDHNITIIFSDGKANRKARLIEQFDFSGKNLALYLYMGNEAKRVDFKYYDELFPSDRQKYSLLVDGFGGNDADFKTHPYIHKTHKAAFQEVEPGKSDLYYFNKTGGILQQGMALLNESGKAIVGIVSDNKGSNGDRFSVIKITAIAQRLEREDNHSCQYFNLLKVGESLTPCEKEEIRKEEERLRHIKEDIERKNRTRQERRTVRRTSDYWFSAGPAVSSNFCSLTMKNNVSEGSASGIGYSLGFNIFFNPNPTARLPMSFRPRYTSTKFSMPENYSVSPTSQLQLQTLSMKSYELPIILETGEEGLFFGVGYVPVLLEETLLSYNVSDEQDSREDEIFGGPEYLHRLHLEVGFQRKNFRGTLIYQHQFETFINRNYEMIIANEVIKPFEGFKKRYTTVSIELSYRLWSRWRGQPAKL